MNHHLANITDTKEEVADGFSRSFKAVQPNSFLGFVYVFNQSFSTNHKFPKFTFTGHDAQ